jgi:hypothetical protein
VLGAYIDETGNTGSRLDDQRQPFHYTGALIVPEEKWTLVGRLLRGIAEAELGDDAKQPSFEFHGYELYGGYGPWRSIPELEDRLKVYQKCVGLLDKHGLNLVVGRCDKRLLRRYATPMHPHEVAFWLCIEKVALEFNQRPSLGYIVADECSRDLKKIAKKTLEDYRWKGPPFGRAVDVSRIIDTVSFMVSTQSPHLQLCDLCLYALRRVEAQPDTVAPNEAFATICASVQARVSHRATFPYRR